MKFIHFGYLLLFIFNSFTSNSQGLGFFSSYEETIEKRTSFVVFANQTPTIKDKLTISFDLSIPEPTQFGYICSIELENKKTIYSLSYLNQNEKSFLKLNLDGETNLLTVPIPLSEWGKGKWNSIKLNFKLNSSDISVSVNNNEFTCTGNELRKSLLADVFFGKHSNIIDVPCFSIRNLNIADSRSNNRFSFEEDEGNTVYNQKGQAIGHVDNPRWLVNDSYHWKHRYTQKSNYISIVQYDQQKNRLIIAEKDSATFVNMIDGSVSKEAYLNKHPVPMILGMSCMNDNNLLLYELRSKIQGHPTIASLNLDSLTWKINSYTKLENERHHHNSYFDSFNQNLYVFGGYGDKTYYKSLHSYNLLSDSWNELNLSGDNITPRFFSGMGELDKHLIIFGGAGNASGDQSIGKKYLYDCYSIDIVNKSVKKLWEIDRRDTRLVSSRNLIFTLDSSAFYTMCYPEYISNTFLKLYRYNLKNGKYMVLGDSIPMVSEQIKTNTNLYSNNSTGELYCVIQQFLKGDSCITKIYSINNPPLPINNKTHRVKSRSKLSAFILAISFITILLLLFILIRRNKRLKNNVKEEYTLLNWKEQASGPTKNAIYLFGDFAVFNRYGKEIAYQFSPQMKELFLYILQKSTEGKFGVSSEQIYSTIWPNKQLKSAKNLKGVTLNKIRNILADIDGIELIFEDKHFTLKTEESLYCDYLKFNQLLINVQLNIDDEDIRELNQILTRGQFLKSIEVEFLDQFKANVSNNVLKISPEILKHYYSHKQFSTCIYFAKSIYFTDAFNTCAFYFTIQSNLALKKVSNAKKHYIKYSLRYQKDLNEEYELLYSDVVKESAKYLKKVLANESIND